MNHNPHELPTDEASLSPVPQDREQESAALAAYDERLREGGNLHEELTATVSLSDRREPSPELTDCLHLLERAWPRAASNSSDGDAPSRIGRFEIERVLGTGGFGVVYLARDPLLRRLIALKLPRLHSLADQGLRERFRREARAAAKLDHPHIVPIYETAEDGPICYIASAYCPGPTLSAWLKQQTAPVPVRLAAALVACLADAVHYSHTQGVLHRDIKPGNVILMPLSTGDGPFTSGELPFVPRLTDFGLAKLFEEERDEITLSVTLGTPSYMAPEQTSRATDEVGPRVDIYALGVILYELLTGRPPFVGDCLSVLLEQVVKEDPVSPRRHRREVSRDLETVCLKCLEKSPHRRYGTARELAADLHRYLQGKPLLARRPGPVDLVSKSVRRRPLLATLLATLAVVAATIPAILWVHNRRLTHLTEELNTSLTLARTLQHRANGLRDLAQQSAEAAERGRAEAEVHRRRAAREAYVSSVRLAELAYREQDIRQCRMFLSAAREYLEPDVSPGMLWQHLNRLTGAEPRELGEASGLLFCLAVSPQQKCVAIAGEGGAIRIIDVDTGQVIRTIETQHVDIRRMAYSMRGDRLAVCGSHEFVSVWSVTTGERLFESSPAPFELYSIVWLDGDRRIAAIGGGADVHVWEAAEGGEVFRLSTVAEKVSALAVSRDGRHLYAGGHDGNVWCWDANSRQLRETLSTGLVKVSCLAISPNDSLLAVGTNDRRVAIYQRAENRHQEAFNLALTDDVRSIDFSAQSEQLAVLEQFGTLRVWTIEQEKQALRPVFRHGWLAHEERGVQLAFLPGESVKLVSVGRGCNRLRLWSRKDPRSLRTLPSPSMANYGDYYPIVFTPDGRHMIAPCPEPLVWSTDTLEKTAFPGGVPRRECLALSRDGRRLAAGTFLDDIIEVWDLTTLMSPKLIWRRSEIEPDCLAFSPSQNLLAVLSWDDDSVRLVDSETGKDVRKLTAKQCHQCEFSPDGRYFAVDELDDVVIWDTSTWQPLTRLKGHLSTILTLAFDPSGRYLASAGDDREIRIWNAATWSLRHTMHGHRAELSSVHFTSDGALLISRDSAHYVKVWDLVTGLELGNLRTPLEGTSSSTSLSPDDRHLAIRLRDGRVVLQRLTDENVP